MLRWPLRTPNRSASPGPFQRRRGTLRLVVLLLVLPLLVSGSALRAAGFGVTRVIGLQAALSRAVLAPRRGNDLSTADLAGTRLLPSQARQQPSRVGRACFAHPLIIR